MNGLPAFAGLQLDDVLRYNVDLGAGIRTTLSSTGVSYISYHLALYINLSIVHRVMLHKKEVT